MSARIFRQHDGRHDRQDYRQHYRQHYRPSPNRLPRWLLRVWAWF